MVVSIIICTCNRAEHLRQTLAAMAGVCVPEAMPTELIVVDNASTDDTAEVVQQCRLSQMPVRYLHEPRRGQCHARNTGMAAAQGQVILFTDDDVRPPKNWIEGMCGPILRDETDAVAGGVKFAPHLEREWMKGIHQDFLASTDNVDPIHPEVMIGANMAFRRTVLQKVPAFDPELGPGALGFGDESLFAFQLQEAGYRLGAALETAVEHHFDPARLSRASFLETAKKMGRTSAYLAYHWKHEPVSQALLRPLKSNLKLIGLRIKHRSYFNSGGIAPAWELEQVRFIHLYKHYLIERKRPHNYVKQGLVKIEH